MHDSLKERCASLSIEAVADEVRRASAWLEAVCTEHRVPAAQLMRLDLCLNEALGNIISHGGSGVTSGPVLLRVEVDANQDLGRATLTVTDGGTPFDPVAAVPAPRPRSLQEAEPGGLGLLMMRESADALSYHLVAGRNELAIMVQWASLG